MENIKPQSLVTHTETAVVRSLRVILLPLTMLTPSHVQAASGETSLSNIVATERGHTLSDDDISSLSDSLGEICTKIYIDNPARCDSSKVDDENPTLGEDVVHSETVPSSEKLNALCEAIYFDDLGKCE